MHKTPYRPTQLASSDSRNLLKVISNPWWQLSADAREVVSKCREPVHNILARLFRSEHQILVFKTPEPTDVGGEIDGASEDRMAA